MIILIIVSIIGVIFIYANNNKNKEIVYSFNDGGKIDREKIEKQLYEIFLKEFEIIYTQYTSIEQLNQNRGTLAPATQPYYEIIAYNKEDNMALMGWSWGNPNNDIYNFTELTISNIQEYEIAKTIIKEIEDNSSYLIFGELEDRDYDQQGKSYWWRVYAYDKKDISHIYDIEGYIDSDNNVEIIFNGRKVNLIINVVKIIGLLIVLLIVIKIYKKIKTKLNNNK